MHLANSQARIGQGLDHAMTLARAGQLDAAEASLRGILIAHPDHHDALQLLGMVARSRGEHEAAITLFGRSLAVRPEQPHVLNNLGNSLADSGRHAEAVQAYEKALAQTPAYVDARLNLALAWLALGQPESACETLQPALGSIPEHARAWAILGQALGEMKQAGRAVDAWKTALSLRPGHVPWLHNLAVALRLVGRAREALPIFRECAARSADEAKIHYNLGHCLQDLGQIDAAAAAYKQAIRLTPTDAELHDSLSRMLWQHGQTQVHVRSYREALVDHPDDPGLLAGLANRLTLAGEPRAAVDILAPAIARGAADADLHYRHGQALWTSHQPDRALAAFEAALAADAGHAPSLRESARALIILDRLAEARPRIERRLAAEPTDQQALALQSILWRLDGDERALWLTNPGLIGRVRLMPGNGDAAAFNDQLDRALGALHIGSRHPLEQTLRGGTQTTDDLFSRDLPEIRAVRAMIEAGVRRYIDALPTDPAHPFLCRKAPAFTFSGSWSVRLHGGGHHTNHIHPEGWISAVYYVSLPEAVGNSEQGWLKFGETGLNLGEREQVQLTVRPEPGLLVLFPSYFYHGTTPFADEDHRTTIAFDIVPTNRANVKSPANPAS
jgi:Tfp pilus assembly protein PilF